MRFELLEALTRVSILKFGKDLGIFDISDSVNGLLHTDLAPGLAKNPLLESLAIDRNVFKRRLYTKVWVHERHLLRSSSINATHVALLGARERAKPHWRSGLSSTFLHLPTAFLLTCRVSCLTRTVRNIPLSFSCGVGRPTRRSSREVGPGRGREQACAEVLEGKEAVLKAMYCFFKGKERKRTMQMPGWIRCCELLGWTGRDRDGGLSYQQV